MRGPNRLLSRDVLSEIYQLARTPLRWRSPATRATYACGAGLRVTSAEMTHAQRAAIAPEHVLLNQLH
jgi:hypothetical protein